MREIARRLKAERDYELSHQQIAKDVAVILKRWRETCVADLDDLRSAELVRIAAMEAEAWGAWERSKAMHENTSTEQTESAKDGRKTRAAIHKVQRDPDPRYLQIVQYCIEKRCKLLGLDAPAKFAATTPDGKGESRATLSVSQLLDRYAAALEETAENVA